MTILRSSRRPSPRRELLVKHSPAALQAVRRRLLTEELTYLLDIVLSGDAVPDRDTAERLVRLLGASLTLHEQHAVDKHGRCEGCRSGRRRWRNRECSVQELLSGCVKHRDG